jgi:hypothetical protein
MRRQRQRLGLQALLSVVSKQINTQQQVLWRMRLSGIVVNRYNGLVLSRSMSSSDKPLTLEQAVANMSRKYLQPAVTVAADQQKYIDFFTKRMNIKSDPVQMNVIREILTTAAASNSLELIGLLREHCEKADTVFGVDEVSHLLLNNRGRMIDPQLTRIIAHGICRSNNTSSEIIKIWRWIRELPVEQARERLPYVLSIVTKCLEIDSTPAPLNLVTVRAALIGLSGLTEFDDGVSALCAVINKRFEGATIEATDINIHPVFDCIYALRTFSRTDTQINQLSTSLAKVLLNGSHLLSVKECSRLLSCCYGVPNARRIDAALTNIILTIVDSRIKNVPRNKLDPRDAATIIGELSVLQGYEFESKYVDSILLHIAKSVFAKELSLADCINLLSAFHGFNDESKLVRRILGKLSRNLNIFVLRKTPKLGIGAVSRALLGMKCMSSEEAGHVVDALASLTEMSGQFVSEDIANCFQGLRHIPLSAKGKKLVMELMTPIAALPGALTTEEIVRACTIVQNPNWTDSDADEIEWLAAVHSTAISRCDEKFSSPQLAQLLAASGALSSLLKSGSTAFGDFRDQLVRRIRSDAHRFTPTEALFALQGLHALLIPVNEGCDMSVLSAVANNIDYHDEGGVNPNVYLSTVSCLQYYETECLTLLLKAMNEMLPLVSAGDMRTDGKFALLKPWKELSGSISSHIQQDTVIKSFPGIQFISCKFRNANGLVALLSRCLETTLRVENKKARIPTENFLDLLTGLRSLSADRPEVVKLLSVVNEGIVRHRPAITQNQFIDSLKNFSGMPSSCPEVIDLLSNLQSCIIAESRVSSRREHQYLHGLQNMDYKDNPKLFDQILRVTLLPLEELTSQNSYDGTTELASPAMLSNLMFGLQGMSFNHITAPVFNAAILHIHQHIHRALASEQLPPKFSNESVFSPLLLSCWAIASNECNNFPSGMRNALLSVVAGLETLLGKLEGKMGGVVTTSERLFANSARKAVEMSRHSSSISISAGGLLHGFEADIIFQVNRGDKTEIINVEVDGPYHKLPRGEKYCRLRDAYLQSRHNIRVIRFDLLDKDLPVSRADITDLFTKLIDDFMG